MDFVIHRDLIGSKRHRFKNEWIDELPEDCWIVGKEVPRDRDLLTALELAGLKIDIEPPKKHSKVIQYFTLKENLPWEMIMPDHAYNAWIKCVTDKISKAYRQADLSYYENVYKKSCKVLEALEPMKIHKKKWNFLSSHNIQGVSSDIIDSFEPNDDGFAEPIQYSMMDTLSGRLKVISGPEILRLNKELKSIIKSRYKGGKIVQFDYVSLEPRLALILAGHNEIPYDIYSYINEKVFHGKFTRDIVKISTLSVMYGAGAKSLSEKTDLPLTECKSTIKQLKEFFEIHKISKRLTKEYQSKKMIKNHFGRAIYPEDGAGHKLFNHDIQSSAVDAAMVGFLNIIELISKTGITPVFIIHDNIGLDFPPENLTNEWFEKIKKAGGEIPGLGGKLLLDSDSI